MRPGFVRAARGAGPNAGRWSTWVGLAGHVVATVGPTEALKRAPRPLADLRAQDVGGMVPIDPS